MTEQYQQNNINAPRGSEVYSSSASLTFDTDLALAISDINPVTLTLPDARQIPGNVIYVKAPFGNINQVTIDCVFGQLIDGLTTISLSDSNSGVILKSNGANWNAFADVAPAPPPPPPPPPEPLLFAEDEFDVTGNVVAGSPLTFFDLSSIATPDGWRGRIVTDLTCVGTNTVLSGGSASGNQQVAAAFIGGVWTFSTAPSNRYSAIGGLSSPGFVLTAQPFLRWIISNSTVRLAGTVKLYGTNNVPPYTP